VQTPSWVHFGDMAQTQKHLAELLKLSREERSELAEALLESLEDAEPPPSDVVEVWAEEIVRRIERNAPGIPAEQVFAEGRVRLEIGG
jgi:hypothetical protein